jgi:biotin transport system substrate-specific component
LLQLVEVLVEMRATEELVVRSESWSKPELFLVHALGAAAFALLTALGAQIRVPLFFTPVPMTLQTFVVPLAGGVLGAAWGSVSMIFYLVLGIAGLPVFARMEPGINMLIGPTSGYLLGFLLAAAFMGFAANHTKRSALLVAAVFASTALIFACGVGGLMLTLHIGLAEAIAKGVTPFLAGDVIKCTASSFVLLSFRQLKKNLSA